MPRARNIKPGYFANELLAAMDAWIRLLFIGLWLLVDRAGRMIDNPRRIQALLFPYESGLPIDDGLQQLHDAGFIERYTVGTQGFIQVTAWTKHQNPHPKEAASTIPEPPLVPATEEPRLVMEKPRRAPEVPRRATETPLPVTEFPKPTLLNLESLNLESLNLESLSLEVASEQPANRIQEFLDAYPKQTKRDAAARAYVSTIDTSQDHEALMAGLERWLASDQWRRSIDDDGGRFIPDPDRFIFDRRYLDHPEPYREGSDPFEEAARLTLAKRDERKDAA